MAWLICSIPDVCSFSSHQHSLVKDINRLRKGCSFGLGIFGRAALLVRMREQVKHTKNGHGHQQDRYRPGDCQGARQGPERRGHRVVIAGWLYGVSRREY
jgi:hypothetical protein